MSSGKLVRYVHGVTDPNAWALESALVCKDRSLTVQSQAEDADINVIVARFMSGAPLPVVAMPPMVGDFTNVPDLRGAMDILNAAQDSFMELPAQVRSRFENDASKFVDFVYSSDSPEHLAELRRMGLAVPEKPPVVEAPPMKVEVVNSTKEGASSSAAK